MNGWSLSLAVMILAAATAGQIINPGHAIDSPMTFSGEPVTTIRTPSTP